MSKDTTKITDKIETEKTFVRYMTKDQQYQFTKTTISKMGEGLEQVIRKSTRGVSTCKNSAC